MEPRSQAICRRVFGGSNGIESRYLAFDRLVRLTEAGALDVEFRGNGEVGADDAILAVLVREDGRIWIAGAFVTMDGMARNRVARLREDGTVDPGFEPGRGPNDWVMALGERSDGGLVLGGVFTEVMGVPRGGVAVLLPWAPSPVSFGGAVLRGDEMLQWSGTAWPRQRYAVERSGDLTEWTAEGEVSAADGQVSGAIPVADGKAGFVRLRRVME